MGFLTIFHIALWNERLRVLKIIYKADDYDKCLQTAKLVSLKEQQDQICIQLIKSYVL